MLSSNELAYMQESIAALLPDTCNILTVTESPDGFGGVTQTWGTASSNVACRLDVTNQIGTDEAAGGASLKSYQQTILSVPYNTTVGNNYRIEHGGFTYNVTATNTDQSWIAVKRVTLERV